MWELVTSKQNTDDEQRVRLGRGSSSGICAWTEKAARTIGKSLGNVGKPRDLTEQNSVNLVRGSEESKPRACVGQSNRVKMAGPSLCRLVCKFVDQ